jgi:hypothetical protein
MKKQIDTVYQFDKPMKKQNDNSLNEFRPELLSRILLTNSLGKPFFALSPEPGEPARCTHTIMC